VQEVDKKRDLCTLPGKTASRSHIAVPTPFTGWKEDFKKFQQQVGLFITANNQDFLTDKAMILFALLYMMEGAVELWANPYVDKALEEEDWGSWEKFLESLLRDFGDIEEPWRALEEMG
jgi:hypothetical protein